MSDPKILIDSERFTITMAQLAQGVINIDSGLTTIEPGSRVHRAMTLLVSMSAADKLHGDTCLVDRETGEVSDGPYYADPKGGITRGWRVCRAGTHEDEGAICSVLGAGMSEAEARATVAALNKAYALDPHIVEHAKKANP